VPAEILNRRKKGFALPTGPWLRGKLHGFARDLLLSDAARGRGYFRPEAVTDLLDRHRAGEDHGERLWNLMTLETWQRELVDGRRVLPEIATRADEIARSGGRQAAGARPRQLSHSRLTISRSSRPGRSTKSRRGT
jgi:hypothetical protein